MLEKPTDVRIAFYLPTVSVSRLYSVRRWDGWWTGNDLKWLCRIRDKAPEFTLMCWGKLRETSAKTTSVLSEIRTVHPSNISLELPLQGTRFWKWEVDIWNLRKITGFSVSSVVQSLCFHINNYVSVQSDMKLKSNLVYLTRNGSPKINLYMM
jgi:hypothetical protein